MLRFNNSFINVIQLCSHIPFYQELSPWILELSPDRFIINIEKLHKYELIALGCFLFNLKFYCAKTNRLVLITYEEKQIIVKYMDSFYNETTASAKYLIENRFTDNEMYSRVQMSKEAKQMFSSLVFNHHFHLLTEKRDMISKCAYNLVRHVQDKHLTISDVLLHKYLNIKKMGVFKKIFQKQIISNYIKELYIQSSGIVVFTGKTKTATALVQLGEDIQNFWIHANYWQISVQPDYIDLLISTNHEFSSLKKELTQFHHQLWTLMNDKTEYNDDILFIARVGYHKNRKSSRKIHKEQQLIIVKKQ